MSQFAEMQDGRAEANVAAAAGVLAAFGAAVPSQVLFPNGGVGVGGVGSGGGGGGGGGVPVGMVVAAKSTLSEADRLRQMARAGGAVTGTGQDIANMKKRLQHMSAARGSTKIEKVLVADPKQQEKIEQLKEKVWFGLFWLGWFGSVWFGLLWFGLVWFGLVLV